MTDKMILKRYMDFLPFLSQVLGPSCEIVLHDVSDLEHSLIAIENNLSGRKIGDPLTDLSLKFLQDYNHSDKEYMLNYSGYVKNKQFLDSTFFIRNEFGSIIGFLCINKDLQQIQDIHLSLDALMNAFNLQPAKGEDMKESLTNIVDHMVSEKIEKAVRDCGIPVERMTKEEKIGVIRTLKDNDVFDLKGAISETATWLNISVPTVYRYLKSMD